MFGEMNVAQILQVGRDSNAEAAVAALLEIAGMAQVDRWVEFPAALLIFLVVPGDPESGAVTCSTGNAGPGCGSISRTTGTEDTAVRT